MEKLPSHTQQKWQHRQMTHQQTLPQNLPPSRQIHPKKWRMSGIILNRQKEMCKTMVIIPLRRDRGLHDGITPKERQAHRQDIDEDIKQAEGCEIFFFFFLQKIYCFIAVLFYCCIVFSFCKFETMQQ